MEIEYFFSVYCNALIENFYIYFNLQRYSMNILIILYID